MSDRDSTEGVRRLLVDAINTKPEGETEEESRKRLEAEHGKVWNTEELKKEFEVTAFLAPFVGAVRLSDGKRGTLLFQHMPRFYFDFTEE